MFKKAVLLTALASFLTVGCSTTQSPDAVAVPKKPATVVVVAPVANTKVAKLVPYSQAMVKLTPATKIENTDQKAILACIKLTEPKVVRPTTIKPDTAKTKVTTTSKGVTTVKMPFTVLNGFGKDEPILATCTFDKEGSAYVELVDI